MINEQWVMRDLRQISLCVLRPLRAVYFVVSAVKKSGHAFGINEL